MRKLLSRKWPAIFALLCGILPQQAAAAASQWEETEGARLRMVAEPARPGETELRGVLQIELEPGWKTYWREPGAAGIPPQITVEDNAISGVTIHYPAPEWHDDPYGSWAGYERPVSLPLTFSLSGDKAPDALEADVFLGICRDVCVPVSAHFKVPVGEGKANAMQTLQLDAAFAALPAGNSERLSIEGAKWTKDGALEVTLHHTASGGEPQLFLSAGANHPFKKPLLVSGAGEMTVFRAEPVFDPAGAGEIDLIATARRGIDAAEIPLTLAAP